jgi:putative glycosyltransferase (TIGR04372 family)
MVELLSYVMTLIWCFARVLGLCWLKISILFKRPNQNNLLLKISEMEIGRDSLWGEVNIPYRRLASNINWDCEWSNLLNLKFRSRELLDSIYPELANRQYVCLHVRTSDYFNDEAYSAPRNADINNYLLAIDWLVAQGICVVRLGGPEMPQLKRKGLLDYAHSSKRSEVMDVHMVEHCMAYIGSQTGPIDLAALFEKRILTLNTLSLSHCFWYRKGSLFLPKHVMLEGRRLSMKERLERQLFEISGTGHQDVLVHYQENTDEEILLAVQEFIAFPELSAMQEDFNQQLERQMHNFCEMTLIWSDAHSDASQKLRWMSRFHGVKGSIAKTYLYQDNWCA